MAHLSRHAIVLKMRSAACPTALRAAMAEVADLRISREVRQGSDEVPHFVGEPWIDRPLVVSTLERLLTPHEDIVDIGRLFSRCATLIQLSSPTIGMFRTSVPAISVERSAAETLAVVVRELAHVAEACVRPPLALRLYLAVEWSGAELVVALACPEAADTPVPTSAATQSLAAAEQIVRAAGGTLVRGVREGVMVFALVFDWVEIRSFDRGRTDA